MPLRTGPESELAKTGPVKGFGVFTAALLRHIMKSLYYHGLRLEKLRKNFSQDSVPFGCCSSGYHPNTSLYHSSCISFLGASLSKHRVCFNRHSNFSSDVSLWRAVLQRLNDLIFVVHSSIHWTPSHIRNRTVTAVKTFDLMLEEFIELNSYLTLNDTFTQIP
jgi:hypothetical protein